MEIPTVNLEANTAGADLVKALTEVGFCYLTNHGIPQDQIDTSFRNSQLFFNQSLERKMEVALNYEAGYYGYLPYKPPENFVGEKFSADKPPERRESLAVVSYMETQWPSESYVPGLRKGACDISFSAYNLFKKLGLLLGQSMQLADPDIFVKALEKIGTPKNPTSFRMMHYPVVEDPETLPPGQMRCGEHTDYGFLTLVFQKPGEAGLQVCTRSGNYVEAVPKENCIVLNVGDTLQRMTDDVLRSAKHKVVIGSEKNQPSRYSQVFFSVFDEDFLVESPSGKYPSITAGDYLKMRFNDSFVNPQGVRPELNN